MTSALQVYLMSAVVLNLPVASLEVTSENSFEQYKVEFGRTYLADSTEHQMRESIFNAKLEDIHTFNAEVHPWKKGLNHMTDMTSEELHARNGFKPVWRESSSSSSSSGSDSMMQAEEVACESHGSSCIQSDCCGGLLCGVDGNCVEKKQDVPESYDWTSLLDTSGEVLEQGHCGSCWAVAATAAIQFSAEIVAQKAKKRFRKVLSPQSILGCTPNKDECGGQGGCKGATAELGFEYVRSQGAQSVVRPIDDQPYTAKDGCDAPKVGSFLQQTAKAGVTLTGWKQLRVNDASHLLDTLVNVGPVAVSIAANGLHDYKSGIFDNSKGDLTVNHAVVAMGFGKDDSLGMRYWKVRNSWGPDWGENGFVRVQRFAPDQDEPTGTDLQPAKGVACKVDGKYPETQEVSGVAGMLLDSAYPVGTAVHASLLEEAAATHVTKQTAEVATTEENCFLPNLIYAEGTQGWCIQQCQHFKFDELAKYYKDNFFGKDPDSCEASCVAVASPV